LVQNVISNNNFIANNTTANNSKTSNNNASDFQSILNKSIDENTIIETASSNSNQTTDTNDKPKIGILGCFGSAPPEIVNSVSELYKYSIAYGSYFDMCVNPNKSDSDYMTFIGKLKYPGAYNDYVNELKNNIKWPQDQTEKDNINKALTTLENYGKNHSQPFTDLD